MKKRILMNLQLFAEDPPAPAEPPTPPANPPASPEIDYDKLAQIVQGKQTVTEDTVLRGYFKNQGLSKEDADKAIADFKEKQKENDPNKKVTELQQKLEKYENEKVLSKKNVKTEDHDYVSYKVTQLMKEKNTTFEKALDSFLKENPRFAESGGGYRVVSTGTPSGGAGGAEDTNDFINAAIRRAAGKEI